MARRVKGGKKPKISLPLKKWQLWASLAALAAGLALLFISLRPPAREAVTPVAVAPIAAAKAPAKPLHPTAEGPVATASISAPAAPPKEPANAPVLASAAPSPAAGGTDIPSGQHSAAPPPSSDQPKQVAVATASALHLAPTTMGGRGGHAHRHYDGAPVIAIVIDDMGVDRRRSLEALRLPGPVTFSFMTYAANLPAEVAEARAHGNGVMIHVPMEPQGRHIDPGPNALMVGQSPEEVRRRLEWGLARVPDATGINNHMGSRFTEWSPGMTTVLEILKNRGFFFLDSRTTPHSVGTRIADQMGVPNLARDVFLDDEMSAAAVRMQLAKTEAVARRTGAAIAIGHPHDATIADLRAWLPSLAGKGFRLVKVDDLIIRPHLPPAESAGVSQVSLPRQEPGAAPPVAPIPAASSAAAQGGAEDD